MLEIGDQAIDERDALSAIRDASRNAGAVVSFTGCVRHEDGEVAALYLQDYSPLTETGIDDAMREAQRRWSLAAVVVRHRTGWIGTGEVIVFVAAAAAHRRDAFAAVDFLMDTLKTDAIFWKKERLASGEERWIEPRREDHADRARWAANA